MASNSYNLDMDIFNQNDAHIRAIADYLATGANAGCDHCLGFELEHFVVEANSHRLIPYLASSDDSPGVRDILERLTDYYHKQVHETQPDGGTWLIGLSRPGLNITLEPGAQLEVSIGPALAISEIERIYNDFIAEIYPILEAYGYELVTLGYHPTACAGDIPLIPKARYRLMDHHFQTTGRHGICMMRASASTQVSIDYSDEQDCVRKFRIASALGPLLAFITDNSPIFEGNKIGIQVDARPDDSNHTALTCSKLPVPKRMVRMAIWDDVDSARSLITPFTFTDGFGYTSYANTLLSAPAIFRVQLDENGEPCPLCGQKSEYTDLESFGSVFANTEFTKPLIEHILSLFFFDTRLKGYMEIRVADSLPLEYALAFTALIKGIFYSAEALDQLEKSLAGVDIADIAAAKASLREDAFQATVYHRNAADWLDALLDLAHAGLPTEEQFYLEPLQELVGARQTLLDLYSPRLSAPGEEHDIPEHDIAAQQLYLDAFLAL
ncbi:MAG: hypothetical protein GX562_04495, partial [Coriobacteriaceae bacterium]|nr:hypothetical protein [Coriobacteriaceae bacterium]